MEIEDIKKRLEYLKKKEQLIEKFMLYLLNGMGSIDKVGKVDIESIKNFIKTKIGLELTEEEIKILQDIIEPPKKSDGKRKKKSIGKKRKKKSVRRY